MTLIIILHNINQRKTILTRMLTSILTQNVEGYLLCSPTWKTSRATNEGSTPRKRKKTRAQGPVDRAKERDRDLCVLTKEFPIDVAHIYPFCLISTDSPRRIPSGIQTSSWSRAVAVHSDVDGTYEGPNVDPEWSLTDDSTILTSSPRHCSAAFLYPISRANFWTGPIGMTKCVSQTW
jgi:hypothetical protein